MPHWRMRTRGRRDHFEYGFYEIGPHLKYTARGVKMVPKKTWISCTPPRVNRQVQDDHVSKPDAGQSGSSRKRKRNTSDSGEGSATPPPEAKKLKSEPRDQARASIGDKLNKDASRAPGAARQKLSQLDEY